MLRYSRASEGSQAGLPAKISGRPLHTAQIKSGMPPACTTSSESLRTELKNVHACRKYDHDNFICSLQLKPVQTVGLDLLLLLQICQLSTH